MGDLQRAPSDLVQIATGDGRLGMGCAPNRDDYVNSGYCTDVLSADIFPAADAMAWGRQFVPLG